MAINNQIPETPFKSIIEAARFYRDLGYVVHPLQSPKNGSIDVKERGKVPILKGYDKLTLPDVTDEFLQRHFGNGAQRNLGLVLTGNQVCVDLDSKADQGESVYAWLAQHPELASIPRERTRGGAHMHLTCPDLPKTKKKKLSSRLNEQVNAEILLAGHNVVVSPSIHASGHAYVWEVGGAVPEITWAELRRLFNIDQQDQSKAADKGEKNRSEWCKAYKGNLRTLALDKLFARKAWLGDVVDAETGKYAVRCPWRNQHSDKNQTWNERDSSTVIFMPSEGSDTFPGFCCSHFHCNERSLEHVLAYFESQEAGIVDQHCAEIWNRIRSGTTKDGRPKVLLPGNYIPDSEFACTVAEILKPKNEWFNKADQVVALRFKKFSEKVQYLAFHPLKPVEVCTAIEQFIATGHLTKARFVPNTMSEAIANRLINCLQFKQGLPEVIRIFTVPLPVLHHGEIVLTKKGYDTRFRSFCDTAAPDIKPLSFSESRYWLAEAHTGFCWKSHQDLTHALARLITPFVRGIIGWDARMPLWFFEANRPRAGKDYLAGVTMLVYEGHVCEDAPLGKDSEETRKRITTALVTGRARMHFANCRGYLDNKDLEQAITSKVWADRLLGSNAEIKLPNELEFSLSANLGLTFTPDLEGRMRKIGLAYPQEDANSREFPKTDLYGWIREHRVQILSAIWGLVQHWQERGAPSGPTPFTSFPEWGRVVGGIMTCCGFGDPCLPHQGDSNVGGDRVTGAMHELFSVCYEASPGQAVDKREIYDLIIEKQAEREGLEFFGDLSESSKDQRSAKTKVGIYLNQFTGRELGGILLKRLEAGSGKHSERAKFVFTKPQEPSRDHGQEVWKSVFSLENASQPAPNSGDVGDVGDLYGAADTEKGFYKKEEEKKNNNTLWEEGSKGPQRRPGPRPACVILTKNDDLKAVAAELAKVDAPVALDIETYGPKRGDALNPFNGDIRLLTLCFPGRDPWILDLNTIGYNLGPLKPALENHEILGHNLKFDALWLRAKCGLKLQKVFCTMIAARLLTAGDNMVENKLGECLRRHLNIDLPKDQGKSDWGQQSLSPEQIAYAANDVAYLHALRQKLETLLTEQNLTQVAKLEMDLLPVVVEMEARGIAVDRDKLVKLHESALQAEKAAKAEIQRQVNDPDFNPASPDQVQKKLAAVGGRLSSTDKDALTSCRHPLAAQVLAFRQAQKRAQDPEKLLKHIADDDRIHARFNADGTDTGRFSSSGPNLQNVGRGETRSAIIPAPGYKFIIADYSQIELRAAAAIAGEEQMIRAYASREDLHKKTASLILQKSLDQITKQDRQLAKAVNFGLIYGQRSNGLVRYAKNSYGVKLSPNDAETFRRRFFSAYPKLAKWHRSANERARAGAKEVRTRTGRRRLLPAGVNHEWDRFTGLVNTVVQGSCADGLKYAMVELARRLPEGAGIVSTVHDELLVEVPEPLAVDVLALVKDCMVSAMAQIFPEVPIEVDTKVACTWADK